MRVYIGIDNGVSGSIGVIRQTPTERSVRFKITPTIKELDYTKTKRNISRINWGCLKLWLINRLKGSVPQEVHVMIERPMINPTRFRATVSACRSMEATLIVLEQLSLSWTWIDSDKWQNELLPSGIAGPERKKASQSIGIRMFPEYRAEIEKHKDADGLLIAEYCRRMFR